MRKLIYCLAFSLLIILSSLFFSPTVYAENTASFRQICGPGPDGVSRPVLIATWSLEQQSPKCNVYIRTSYAGDILISTSCRDSYRNTLPGLLNGTKNGQPINVPLDDGGTYTLYASTGKEAPGGGFEEVIKTIEDKKYCERAQGTGGTRGGGASNIEQVFGKINPPAFVQNIGSGEGGISRILTGILNIIYVIAIIAFVFMFVWGAAQWILSGGEKDKVAAAKQRITHAFIGIVILALAAVVITTFGKIVGFTFFS